MVTGRDTREAAKKRVEVELAKKIEGAEGLLRTLRQAVAQVYGNSNKAKGEVNLAYEVMHARLVNRKVELTRQIDLISHIQISSLQEGIQGTLMALGSLQATLTNLESFDNTQLLSLHIPDLPLCCNVPASSVPIEVSFNEGDAQQKVSQWGNVTAKGIEGLVDVGSTVSMPKRYVEYNDEKVVSELMSHKPVTSGQVSSNSSVVDFRVPPKLPNFFKRDQVPVAPNLQEFNLEDWLLTIKTSSCPSSVDEDVDDDFELVDVSLGEQEILNLEKDLKLMCNVDNCKSSQEEQTSEDLSKWLCRPRKRSYNSEDSQPDCPPNPKYSVPVPLSSYSGDVTNNQNTNLTNRNNIIEFPCLQMKDTDWISTKKTNRVIEKPLFGMNDFIPPAYALPTPFWLKKSVLRP